ncbi:MAG: AzlD domain-containing protein [Acidobacteria bacterium]|nr:AzlD domain-containing protein [Acidobacteriota bacterium]
MSLAWQFLLAGIGTYLIRASAIVLVGHGVAVPARLERTLRLIAPAVLAAIVANGLLLEDGRFNLRVSWFAGTLVAISIVRRFRSAAWAIAAAMLVVWAVQQAGVR